MVSFSQSKQFFLLEKHAGWVVLKLLLWGQLFFLSAVVLQQTTAAEVFIFFLEDTDTVGTLTLIGLTLLSFPNCAAVSASAILTIVVWLGEGRLCLYQPLST